MDVKICPLIHLLVCKIRECLSLVWKVRVLYRVLKDENLSIIVHCVSGKTLLAKAVANQTSATFLRVVGSELIQKYLVSTSQGTSSQSLGNM